MLVCFYLIGGKDVVRKDVKILLAFMVLSLIFLIQPVAAEFPISHHEHTDAVNALNINSNLANKCKLHPDLC